jgi:hypothetical protein
VLKQRRLSEKALVLVRDMSDEERSWFLRQLSASGLVPEWYITRRADYERQRERLRNRSAAPKELSGKQAHLCVFCLTYKRAADVIRHLWPVDAARSPDLRRDKRLQTRLRVLVSRTNTKLRLFRRRHLVEHGGGS